MDFKSKTRVQLIKELVELRHKVAGLVADRKRYRKVISDLGKREELFYALIEKSPLAIIIFSPEDKTEYINPKFIELFGYTIKDIPSRRVWRNRAYPIPRYRRQVIQEISALETSGRKGLTGSERRITCADGSTKEGMLYSVYLADARYCVIMADITELKRDQKDLEISRERFRTVYKNSPVPAFLWQRDGDDFTLVDFSFSADEFTKGNLKHSLGTKLSNLFNDMPHLVEDVKRCFSDQNIVKNEYPYRLRSTGEMKNVASFYIFIPPDLVLIYFVDITEYKRIEKSLKENEKRLELEARRLEEANTALKVLLDYRGEEKGRIQENVVTMVTRLILPFVEKLESSSLTGEQRIFIDAIKLNLDEITSPLATKLSYRQATLSPMELAVANLVRLGKSIKEAADTLNITEDTVRFHRKNIRAKLGLKNRKLNLYSYLQRLSNE
jgi:PAS domain S-box-containing protein